MGKQHDKDNEPAQGRKAALHSTEVSFNESDRKIKLLSDSYWLGFLEKKFVNWQQREREEKKQQDAAKDLARKNKILADLYRTRYKAWLIKEKSKYNSFPIISSLFKRNTSLAGENSRKFPFGVPDIALEFIKGGSFLIGNDAGNIYLKTPGRNSEQPYRAVTVNDFYVGRYPVTMRQWSKAMGVEVEGAELDSPVQLNWDGVQEFISRLNGITGLEFRIPTEAEWEYAGRSGGKNEDLSELADGATNNSTASRAGRKVGQCKPNALGLFDMLGNSGEWVSGSSTRQTRRTIPQGTSRGAGNSGRQVIRGAVHRDLHVNLHFSYAFQRNFPPADKVHRYSFRLAHSSL